MERNQRRIFAQNLQYYMSLRQKRQADLARDLHVTTATAANWYNGTKVPKIESQEKLARYLGVTVADLMSDRSQAGISPAARIPVYAYVGAGFPHFADEDIVGEEEVSAALARTGEYFGLKVRGNSMEPKISSGDVLIVRKQGHAENGDIVIAMVNGDEAVCKRLKVYRNGLSLISSNPAYDPMFFTDEEVESLPVKIIGVCVEVRAKLK